MTIIKFPNAANCVKHKDDTLFVEKINPSDFKTWQGPWSFTCTECATITTFDTSKMIFKTLEFHCHCCGTLYKVGNPSLANKKKQTPTQNTKNKNIK